MLERGRSVVGDAVWEKVAPLLPGKASDPGATARDNRLFLEAVLWRGGGGAPRGELAGGVGGGEGADGRPVARLAGRVRSLEQRLPAVPPLGEGRHFRARLRMPVRRAGLRIRPDRRHYRHRPPEGEWRQGGTQNQAIGRSRGGLTTKIVALVDALGTLVRFILLPGQRHDSVGVQ